MKFILATTDPQKIPVTVLSPLPAVQPQADAARGDRGALRRILAARKDRVEAEALPLRARRRAAACATRCRCSTRRSRMAAARWRRAAVGEMLGAIDQSYLVRLLECVAAGDARWRCWRSPTRCSRAACRSMRRSRDLASLLPAHGAGAIGARRARGVCRARAHRALAATPRPGSRSSSTTRSRCRAGEDLPLAPDEHAGFLMTVLRMLAFRPGRLRPTSRCRRRKAQSAAGRCALPQTRSALRPRGDWPALVARAAGHRRRARELARNAELQRRENGVFELVRAEGEGVSRRARYVDKLKAALDQHLGAAVRVNVSVGEVARRDAPPRSRRASARRGAPRR